MRIAVSSGHNVYINNVFDPGAVGNGKRESDINKETVGLLISLLRSQGHTVLDVTPYNEKFRSRQSHHELRCKRVDAFNADIYLDIHINAGGGTGCEVWCHNANSKSVPYATEISKNISVDMDLHNRGVKFNPTYWSLYLTKKPAMIIEGAFIDNKLDMDKLTAEKYAISIAKAFGEVTPSNNEQRLYKVQVGAFRVRENAEKLLTELKDRGFEGFIITDKKESEK
ncbi:MAG: N-acetylmuramoyl-L-alanine amidase [Tissierella sp.]|nr:N-acetylmuramoyl-L-alanine amidase [Tissierella sp.]